MPTPEERAYQTAYYRRHRAKKLAYQKTYRLSHAEERKAYESAYYEAHREQAVAAGHERYARKREAILQRQRAYTARNKEAVYAKNKAYAAANRPIMNAISARHAARKRGAAISDLSAAQWEEIKAAYGYRCVYCPPSCWRCQRKAHRLEREDITPVARGGNHTVANVVPACRSCNAKKHTGPPPTAVQPLLLTVAPKKPRRQK